MKENLKIWNELRKVPGQAKKTITAGRLKGMTDIKPQWRIQMMTEQFGPIGIGWYYDTVRTWTEEHGGEVSAHVEVKLYFKHDGEWSAPISGTGGAMLLSMEKTKEYDKPVYEFPGLKPYHSDEAYKMATTDALSVAMKQIGVAADVYMGLSDSKYDKVEEVQKADESQRKTLNAYLKRFTEAGDVKAIDYIADALNDPSLSHDKAQEIISHAKAKVG